MAEIIRASTLADVFEEYSFSREEQSFYQEALQRVDPVIQLKYFVGNVDIEEAVELENSGEVIGAPIGLADFIAPLQEILVARSPCADSLSKTFDDMRSNMPTTQDEIKAGRLGHYTLAPIMNVYQALELSPEDFQKAMEELSEQLKIYTADFNNPEIAAAAREFFQQKEKALLLQTALDHSTPRVKIEHDIDLSPRRSDPVMDGPTM